MDTQLLTKVRLKEFELKAIIDSFRQLFLPTDHLWLFGSRADLSRRGGDIDLYIETNLPPNDVYDKRSSFLWALYDKIGEQKIDIMVHIMQDSLELPIYAVARAEGAQLV